VSHTATPGRPKRWKIVGSIVVLCAVWGTTWSVIQIGLRGIPPFTGVAVRFAVSGALLLGLAFALGIRLVVEKRGVESRRIAAGGFDFDDVSTHVGEQLARPNSGLIAELQNPQAIEGAGECRHTTPSARSESISPELKPRISP